ncbi:MAG TPA: DUF5615 family PIN-like protein [Humibacillus sp.]|nr:DUF5615 family PIN-like protein [Humibacillus sp.]
MTAFLIDEMLPPAAARLLREEHGHDAVHVSEVGLTAADDSLVSLFAREEHRALVTENVVDFVLERDVVLVFVLKRSLPAGSAMGAALAQVLDEWARRHPEPYVGAHWPT